VLPELDGQLPPDEANQLRGVLVELSGRVGVTLADNLIGVYLHGSFALGAGDVHADVDFLVVTRERLTREQEASVRSIHAQMPDFTSHWAHNLEGGYALLANLRQRASRDDDWLYVDNGNRDMEWSAHDNTEVFRWVLRNRGLPVTGPAANTIIDHVPAQTLRDEVAVDAQVRQRADEEDPWIFGNAWGQPHVVLAWCRMLYTATLGEVKGKNDAARWAIDQVPREWHPLIDRAISDRPDPWGRVHREADPGLAGQTPGFVTYATPEIVRAAAQPMHPL